MRQPRPLARELERNLRLFGKIEVVAAAEGGKPQLGGRGRQAAHHLAGVGLHAHRHVRRQPPVERDVDARPRQDRRRSAFQCTTTGYQADHQAT